MNREYIYILPECYVDTNLIETLMQIKGVSHQSNCSIVTRKMQTTFKDGLAVGIIDKDKMQPPYLKEFVELAHSEELTLLKHPQKHHYIIEINHVMERFILSCAADLDVDLAGIGMPTDLRGLMERTKHVGSKKDLDIKKMIKELSSSKEMMRLSKILNYIHANKYNSKVDDLKKFFD